MRSAVCIFEEVWYDMLTLSWLCLALPTVVSPLFASDTLIAWMHDRSRFCLDKDHEDLALGKRIPASVVS